MLNMKWIKNVNLLIIEKHMGETKQNERKFAFVVHMKKAREIT